MIYQGSSNFVGKWKADISSKIQSKEKEETTTKTPSQKVINRRVQSQIDQENLKITQLTQQTTEHEEKLVEHQQDIDGLKQSVQDTVNYKREIEGVTELHITDAGKADVLELEIRGNKNYVSDLFPRTNLYPRSGLQPNQRGG